MGIRHIASHMMHSDLFASGEARSHVDVWSLVEHRKVSSFETVLDLGGDRLALLPAKEPMVVSAAWARFGIWGYQALTGTSVWQRRDLKKCHRLFPLIDERHFGARLEGRAMVIVDSQTGETVTSFPSVTGIFESPYSPLALHVEDRRFRLVSPETGATITTAPLGSFAVLDAAFSPSGFAVSEAAGTLRCFDLDGKPRWEWRRDPQSHALKVAWNETIDAWHCIVWDFQQGGPRDLNVFGEGGELLDQRSLGSIIESGFFDRGRLLIASIGDATSSVGQLLDMPSGKVVWEFHRSTREVGNRPPRSRDHWQTRQTPTPES